MHILIVGTENSPSDSYSLQYVQSPKILLIYQPTYRSTRSNKKLMEMAKECVIEQYQILYMLLTDRKDSVENFIKICWRPYHFRV